MSGREYIVCVDDEAIILHSLKHELKSDPFFGDISVELAESGRRALDLVREILADGGRIPVLVSDQRMPVMQGDAFLMEAHALVPDALKILLTGFADLSAVVALVNHDVLYRYLSKPWNRHDLVLTMKTAVTAARQKLLIEEQACRIRHLTLAMVSTLESANLVFDEDTGRHIMRIAQLSAHIARSAGLDGDLVDRIRLYAPLHDIGKVGVRKDILQKPSALDPEEFAQVKEHVRIGHRIIDNEEIDPVAKNIVLYHHEKWAGGGYLSGLSGEGIPVEARVVSIADVLDALTNERVYKAPMPLADALAVVRTERGASFDPALVDALLANMPPVASYGDLMAALD